MYGTYHEWSLQDQKLFSVSQWVDGVWMWIPSTLLYTTEDFINSVPQALPRLPSDEVRKRTLKLLLLREKDATGLIGNNEEKLSG